MTSIRALVARGDLPSIQNHQGQCDSIFERALCHGVNTKFRAICALFTRDTPTDMGPGEHYLYGMVGSTYAGAHETIMAIARHQGIAVMDLTGITARVLEALTIRDIVQFIMDTPPRCAILLSMESTRMMKVVKRMAKQQVDLRFRRVVFCLASSTERLPDGVESMIFPGSTDDKIQMLLCKVPVLFTADSDRLRPIAKVMTDYSVFEPRIWCHVETSGNIQNFLSTFMFQVNRCTTIDVEHTLDIFPSFESGWRRSFAMDLQKQLIPAPDATCRALHSVLPAGVSPQDAIKCIQTAIPNDLTDPYALPVASSAVDDRCGSICITQPTHHVVVHVKCVIDPAILSEVCRELRIGHRQLTQELVKNKHEMIDGFSSLRFEIEKLKEWIEKKQYSSTSNRTCSKRTCCNVVDDTFGSGKTKRQCRKCIASTKRKSPCT
jgi:hypothetical protein